MHSNQEAGKYFQSRLAQYVGAMFSLHASVRILYTHEISFSRGCIELLHSDKQKATGPESTS